MKQLFWGLGLFAALLAVCLGAFSLLYAGSAETAALLAQAQSAGVQGDIDEALDYSVQAQDSWTRHGGFIETIMCHEETDDIGREFSDLLVYAQAGNREEFLASCGRLLVMVEHLPDMERPVLRNLLAKLA